MHCPQCNSAAFDLTVPCPECAFSANGRLLERLSNLNYLLNEMETWRLSVPQAARLTKRYQKQRRAINVDLGLRPPPPDIAETHELHLQLDKRTYLLEKTTFWINKGWISAAVRAELTTVINKEIAHIKDSLIDAPAIIPPGSFTKQALRRWELVQYSKEAVEQLCKDGQMPAHACTGAMVQLDGEIEQLELAAGLRQPEPVSDELEEIAVGTAVSTAKEPEPVRQKRRKREPFSWDKVWESLLSERTLHAILFLGVVLLFASGVSWVAWNWGTFPPIVQITVLGGYTTFFYGLGWYVRVKMNLRGSGIALSAVGALLLPLDFYAFYLSGGFPSDSWPFVWLLASAVCLIAYTLTAVSVQAPFFGYLVSVAMSSIFAAAANVMGFAVHWQIAAISASALLQALLGDGLRRREGKFHILAVPLGQMALATAVPIMAVTFIWGFFDGTGSLESSDFSFQLARAASWIVGSITMLLMTRHYRLRPFILTTVLAIPIALWMTQGAFFILRHTDAGWHAPGWVILAALYFVFGRGLSAKTDDFATFKPIIFAVGWLLIILSALWGLMDAPAAATTYLLLAGVMVLLARLWNDKRPLWLMSLFLLLGSGNWMAWREATLAELTLPWSLLAILHIIVALRIDSRRLSLSKAEAGKGFDKLSRRYTDTFAAPLFGSAVLIAFAALLPPAILFDQPLLIYALGNWIGINGWLAYLAHRQDSIALQTLLSHRRLRPIAPALFHWLTALPLVGWVWLLWDNGNYDLSPAALLYALLAWVLLGLCLRLRRARWAYDRPWQTAAHLSNTIALAIIVVNGGQPWTTAVFFSTAIFYFLAVFLLHNNRWFYIGGLLLPLAFIASVDQFSMDGKFINPALALLPLVYITAVIWLENRHGKLQSFTRPLIRVTIFLSIIILTIAATEVLFNMNASADRLALAAVAPLLIAVTFTLYAWHRDKSRWAHAAIWLATAAFAVIGAAYSHGSGRSATLAALLAVVYVLTERGLHQLARSAPIVPKHAMPTVRRAWRFFKRPLLFAGWAVSAIAIGMALVRNLVVLGGGSTREIWAAIALTLIVGLYALSARLFRNAEFVWIASILAIAPWSIAAHLIFWVTDEWFSIAWAAFALALTAVGIKLAQRFGLNQWSWPPLVVAHVVMPFALFWEMAYSNISPAITTVPLAILFYLTAAWIDRYFRRKEEREDAANPRFLYPMTMLMPVWAVYLLLEFAPGSPNPTLIPIGLLVLAFALPMLLVGRRLSRWEASYGLPFYLTAYGTAVIAIPLVITDLPVFAGVLFFNSGIALLSVLLFRQPLWFYPATVLLPTAVSVVLIHNNADAHHYGWAFVGLAALYLAVARLLRHFSLRRYETPLLVMMFTLIAIGLPFSSFDREGALVGYGVAMATLALAAIWLRKPLIFSLAVALAMVPYWTAVSLLNVNFEDAGLAAWPFILSTLALGRWLDQKWGMEPTANGRKAAITRFPWHNPFAWSSAFWQRWTAWWAFSLYTMGLWFTAVSALLSIESEWRWALVLALGTAVYVWATFRFRSKGWLLAAGTWAQFTALALMRWTWAGWADEPAWLALAFMPITTLTFAAALVIEYLQNEGTLLAVKNKQWSLNLSGWSRPFLLLFFIDLFFGQLMTLFNNSGANAPVTLLHGVMIGLLATVWHLPLLAYLTMALGAVAMAQLLQFLHEPETSWPPMLALLATIYGAIGYNLRRRQLKLSVMTVWMRVWKRPLIRSGWTLSFVTLALLLTLGINLPQTIISAALWGRLPTLSQNLEAIMAIRTFAILGLFYLAAALAENRPRLSYLALTMLFAAWSIWLLLIQNSRELQLYALPVGLYLLAVGWMEWKSGRRGLARWIDTAAVLLLFGSAFWQSFGDYGAWYALLMIIEGLLIGWLGSLRRLRRLLYAGVAGVVTAVFGQLIEPLFALNTFALLILGAMLVALGIGLERRLEAVRELSKEFRLKLDEWE